MRYHPSTRSFLLHALSSFVSALGRIPPSAISAKLRFYARFVTLAERLSNDAEVRSVSALAQYILVGYVQRATGRFHDRATSGLIAEVPGRPAYNEITQRMWRSRNFVRYKKNFDWFIAQFPVRQQCPRSAPPTSR